MLAQPRQQAQQAYGQYQRSQVETSSPGQLVVLLYQGCMRFTQRGRLALEAQEWDGARTALLRAQDIVAELMSSLNMDAGEIAANLLRLYEYMYQRLVTANVKRDPAAAAEVEELLRSLLPAWEEAVKRQPEAPGDSTGRVNVSLRG